MSRKKCEENGEKSRKRVNADSGEIRRKQEEIIYVYFTDKEDHIPIEVLAQLQYRNTKKKKTTSVQKQNQSVLIVAIIPANPFRFAQQKSRQTLFLK
jgi:hypothetical protein